METFNAVTEVVVGFALAVVITALCAAGFGLALHFVWLFVKMGWGLLS